MTQLADSIDAFKLNQCGNHHGSVVSCQPSAGFSSINIRSRNGEQETGISKTVHSLLRSAMSISAKFRSGRGFRAGSTLRKYSATVAGFLPESGFFLPERL